MDPQRRYRLSPAGEVFPGACPNLVRGDFVIAPFANADSTCDGVAALIGDSYVMRCSWSTDAYGPRPVLVLAATGSCLQIAPTAP